MPGSFTPGLGDDPFIGQSFFLDLQGAIIGAFTQCSGFSSSSEVVNLKQSDKSGRTYWIKRPGKISYNNVTLSKGITDNLDVWKWIDSVAQGKVTEARKNGTISLCDPLGAVVAQWELKGVLPVRVTGPTLSADGTKIGVEEVELSIEAFTRNM